MTANQDGAAADIVLALDIDADAGRVWTVLTSPEHVLAWLGCMRYAATIDALFYMQPDAAKRAADDIAGATHCRLLELSEPRLFRFSWYFEGSPETEVAIRLSPLAGGGTRVDFAHSGWDQFDAAEIGGVRGALEAGWRDFVLPALGRRCVDLPKADG